MPDRAGLARTHSVPLRRRSSMKGCSQSPTRQELHAFETLLDGTGAQMPNRMQLLATHSMSRYSASLCHAIYPAHRMSKLMLISSIVSMTCALVVTRQEHLQNHHPASPVHKCASKLAGTWDCGQGQFAPCTQYSATSAIQESQS